ncbi:MAG TPA: SIMPL domain-containing protein [Acidimicrobiales bacterium]|nr:SIMPL domain-containing protein [Acidimicrobiales bacterium]
MTRYSIAAAGFCGFIAFGGLVASCGTSHSPTVASPPLPNCASSAPKLTVTASGQATGTPDLLTMVVGVQATGTSAQIAMSSANSEASGVIGALRTGGVQPSDIQTTNLSVFPTYDKNGNINGYSVNNTVIAKLHDPTGQFASAGALIDSVAGQAGNDIRLDGINFSVQNQSSLEGQARADAVNAAKIHAQDMVVATGERLGGICSLTDTSDNTPTNPALFNNSVAAPSMQGAGSSAGTPIQAGTQQVTANASIVYSLIPAASKK